MQPPPAWLIVSDTATAATYGSYCYGVCVDTTAPQHLPHLATTGLPADAQAVIVIGSQAIKAAQVGVGDWTANPTALFDFPGMRMFTVEGAYEGNVTVFTLKPLHKAGDQFLVFLSPSIPAVMQATSGGSILQTDQLVAMWTLIGMPHDTSPRLARS